MQFLAAKRLREPCALCRSAKSGANIPRAFAHKREKRLTKAIPPISFPQGAFSGMSLYVHVELVIRDLHVRRDQGVGDALHEVGFDVVVIFRFRPDFQGEDERTCRLFGEHDGGSGIFEALAVFRNAAQDHVLGALIVLGVRHAEVEVEAARGLGGEVGELVRSEVGVGNTDQLVGGGVDIGIHDGDIFHDTRCALAAYLVTHPKRARNENDDARGEVGQAALQGKTDGHAQRGDRGGN